MKALASVQQMTHKVVCRFRGHMWCKTWLTTSRVIYGIVDHGWLVDGFVCERCGAQCRSLQDSETREGAEAR